MAPADIEETTGHRVEEIKNSNVRFYYHKDTKTFDDFSASPVELEHIDYNAKLTDRDKNNVPFPSYEKIDHKGIMRFFVRDCVDDKESRGKRFALVVHPVLNKNREMLLVYPPHPPCRAHIQDLLLYRSALFVLFSFAVQFSHTKSIYIIEGPQQDNIADSPYEMDFSLIL